MLRKLLHSTAIVAVSFSFANAADPVPVDDPVPPTVSEIGYDWTGLYVGGQVGYSKGSVDWREALFSTSFGYVSNTPGDFIDSNSPSGAFYGGFAGYNWQIDNWVFGIEASYSASSLTDTTPILAATFFNTTEVKSILTVGPRIGIANDNLLMYIEGGYASAEVDISFVSTVASSYSASGNIHGYYLGVGLDYALNSNWVIGLEYNYIQLDNTVLSGTFGAAQRLDIDLADFDINTITARLAYKF